MNRTQVVDMEHALNNGNRFYTDATDKSWLELESNGLATRHKGWEEDMAYFCVTEKGEEALELTDFQKGKLKHAFGLDYSKKPCRNYYHCNKANEEWEDMISKGYATKSHLDENTVVYYGTLKGLQLIFRKNVTHKYFYKIES